MRSVRAIFQIISLLAVTFTFSEPLYAQIPFDFNRLNDAEEALFQAVKDNDVETIENLQKEDVNLKATDLIGRTALHIAVESNSIDVLKFLIKAGVDLEAKEIDGWTALYCAVNEDNPETIDILLEAGADFRGNRLSWMDTFTLGRTKK